MKLSSEAAFQFASGLPSFILGCLATVLGLIVPLFVLITSQTLSLSAGQELTVALCPILIFLISTTYFLITAKKDIFNYRGTSGTFFVHKTLLMILFSLCFSLVYSVIFFLFYFLLPPLPQTLAILAVSSFFVYTYIAFLMAYTERFNMSDFLDKLTKAFSSPSLIIAIAGQTLLFLVIVGVLAYGSIFLIKAWNQSSLIFILLFPMIIGFLGQKTRGASLLSLLLIPFAVAFSSFLPKSAGDISGGVIYVVLFYLYLSNSLLFSTLAFFCHLVIQSVCYLTTGETLEERKTRELLGIARESSDLTRLKESAQTTNTYAKTY